mmetsp:Transcript_12862/g.29173  ORF Transcript_12862/g.29173 Transcript_12862/m.29173 type:complete len:443 (-) Transcript_12862:31-1359(-)
MALGDHVLEVDLIEGEVQVRAQHGRDHRQADLLLALANRIDDGEDRLVALVLDQHQVIAEVRGHGHLVGHLVRVAAAAQAQELVELHVDALSGAGEVEGVGVRAAAQVGHVDGHAVGQALALAPDDPAGATAGVAKLVAARGDREYTWEAEVPGGQVRLEGGDEAAGGPIDVDAHLKPSFGVDLRQDLVDVPHGVVLAAVVVAHDADHADGLLIDNGLDRAGIKSEGLPAWSHEAGLDVHVLEELLPRRLEHGGDHQVWVHASDLVLVHAVLLHVPLAPAELERQAGQQAGLRGANSAGTGVAPVLVEVRGLRAVPELRDHVEGVVVHLEGLRVHGLVGKVDLEAHRGNLLLLRLEDDVHVRARVQALREVEQVVVLNLAEAVPGSGARLGEGHVILGEGLRMGACVVGHGDGAVAVAVAVAHRRTAACARGRDTCAWRRHA